MLRRTILLFLCVSFSLSATISLFHMRDEETPAPEPTPVLDTVVEAVDGNIQDSQTNADEITNNASPPTEEESLFEKIIGNEKQPAVDQEVQEVHAATEDVVPTEEVMTKSDSKTEDILDANLIQNIIEDSVIQDKVEDNVIQDKVEDSVIQDKVEDSVIQDKVEDSVIQDKVEDSVIQDQLPQQDNEIVSVQTEEVPKQPEEQKSRWSLGSIRNSFQNMNGYFDSLVELVGGRNGVCQYRCRYGEVPGPRPGYQLPEPNGCSSSLVGFQLDLGIPAMTQCCNQLDSCYDTCGTSKYDCDSSFRSCLHGICSDLKKSLGLGTQYQTCESMADGLFNTVWTLGCRPYMNSQRAACICEEEERDEL